MMSNDTVLTNERAKEKLARKSVQKQKRAYHRLLRDMNIKCSTDPTKFLMICNAGLVTGLQRETLKNLIDPLDVQYDLIMPPRKSYCFIKFYSLEHATRLYNSLNGYVNLDGASTPLYVSYTESVPDLDDSQFNCDLLPGLTLIEDVITEEEEKFLLNSLDWDNDGSASAEMKHRKVKHFGYEFQYGSNTVDPDRPIAAIPPGYNFLQDRFTKRCPRSYQYDQLTINCYLPGQGIPPHIDTHSVFEDTIVSLSLGSACVMDFKREDKKAAIFLPPRSLLIMAGEARYAWTHGICPRSNDIVKTEDGITTQSRSTRVSFTFRKVRRGDCRCTFPQYCDTKQNSATALIDAKSATGIEHSYVHEVYEEISSHFNETRHKQWPNVTKFLECLDPGDLLLDVGCGNGKYLKENKHVFKMGCDRSHGLMEICRCKGFEVLLSDCLRLPYRDDSLDAVISIAVIHHLSTGERRRQAISELMRVLRPTGKCLIYVWAKEQEKNSTKSTYIKYNSCKKEREENLITQKLTEYGIMLPVHENRTEFTCSDMLVPWKRKGGGDFLRYYHVFEENELANLCREVSDTSINKVYYDQGNWCVLLEKMSR